MPLRPAIPRTGQGRYTNLTGQLPL